MLPDNTKFDLIGVARGEYGLRLAVVRGTGSKSHYRHLFGHIASPGAQNRQFVGIWGHFGLPVCPRHIVPIVPLGL